jgi:putative transposase
MTKFFVRRSLRLSRWTYDRGAYFVTMCTARRKPLLATSGDRPSLSEEGRIVDATWAWLESRYDHVFLDEWCVMSYHVHGIIILVNAHRGEVSPRTRQGASGRAVTASVTVDAVGTGVGGVKPLGALMGAFKVKSTNAVNRIRSTPGGVLWQGNYYEHIIRDAADMNRIREYIQSQRLPTL